MYPGFALTLFSLLPFSGHLIQAAPAPVSPSSPSKGGQNPPLRGSDDLVGYSPSHNVPIKDTSVQYHLVPGQKEQPNDGRYLKFEDVDQPQPIRGNKGGTDPGPSMCYLVNHSYFCVGMVTDDGGQEPRNTND